MATAEEVRPSAADVLRRWAEDPAGQLGVPAPQRGDIPGRSASAEVAYHLAAAFAAAAMVAVERHPEFLAEGLDELVSEEALRLLRHHIADLTEAHEPLRRAGVLVAEGRRRAGVLAAELAASASGLHPVERAAGRMASEVSWRGDFTPPVDLADHAGLARMVTAAEVRFGPSGVSVRFTIMETPIGRRTDIHTWRERSGATVYTPSSPPADQTLAYLQVQVIAWATEELATLGAGA